VHFEVVGELKEVETIAAGRAIRDLRRLQRVYGRGRWRKLKGIAPIRDRGGSVRMAELYWYEASGIGRKEVKRKRYLD
jgi:hypothetical protein